MPEHPERLDTARINAVWDLSNEEYPEILRRHRHYEALRYHTRRTFYRRLWWWEKFWLWWTNDIWWVGERPI